MTLEERLNNILEEKEIENNELRDKIEELELKSDLSNLEYQAHQYFKESELQKELPVPRLEMRFMRHNNYGVVSDNWYSVSWHYGIVYKHYSEIDNDTMLFIPISRTTSNGGRGDFESFLTDGRLDTPFRDGLHIFADSKIFNLPAYIICEEKNIVQEIILDIDITTQLDKMVRGKTTKDKSDVEYGTMNVVLLPALIQSNQVEEGNFFINDSRVGELGKLEALKCERLTINGHAWNGDGMKTFISHLYFTTDERPNVGDYYLVELFNIEGESTGLEVERCETITDIWVNNGDVNDTRHIENCKKLVGTTDPQYGHLPRPSKKLITQYCAMEGNMDNVSVELLREFTHGKFR